MRSDQLFTLVHYWKCSSQEQLHQTKPTPRLLKPHGKVQIQYLRFADLRQGDWLNQENVLGYQVKYTKYLQQPNPTTCS